MESQVRAWATRTAGWRRRPRQPVSESTPADDPRPLFGGAHRDRDDVHAVRVRPTHGDAVRRRDSLAIGPIAALPRRRMGGPPVWMCSLAQPDDGKAMHMPRCHPDAGAQAYDEVFSAADRQECEPPSARVRRLVRTDSAAVRKRRSGPVDGVTVTRNAPFRSSRSRVRSRRDRLVRAREPLLIRAGPSGTRAEPGRDPGSRAEPERATRADPAPACRRGAAPHSCDT